MVAAKEAKILIVDDDARNLMVLEALLADLAPELVSARSGEEALRKLLEAEFAVVLLDVQMPGMDGFETARLLRQREASAATPIIFLTAINSDVANVLRGYSVGAVDFITKPIEAAILRSKVQVFIDLFRKTEEVRRQAEQLRRLEQRAHEQELAVEKAHQAEVMARTNERLSVMTRAMTTFLQRGSWREAAHVLLDGAMDLARSTAGFAATVEDGGAVRVWVQRGWDELLEGSPSKTEAAAADGWALAEPQARAVRELVEAGREVWADQAARDGRLSALVDGRRDLVRAIACPVPGREGAVGLLALAGERMQDPELSTTVAVMAQTASVLHESHSRSRREAALSAQLRQAQKMEAIGNLAGGIAHDFNNLLTVIHGYVGFLLSGLKTEDPQRENAVAIQEAATQAAWLTRQLLAFSRKQVLQPRVFELNAMAAQTQKMLRRLIGEHIVLETRFEPGAGRLRADPAQLEQVLMNLAVNARDAMPHGGRLMISTRAADVRRGEDGPRPGPYVLLTVADTGTGMDEATRSRIFEPFFTTKEVGKGTGLGLATVYGIVQQSGGHIDVTSAPGRGTTFRIWFPRVEEEAVEAVRESIIPSRRAPAGEVVLLVEDERPVRTLARRILEQNGFWVLEADSGEKALAICERHEGTIHILVTDMVMPGMNGRDLAQKAAECRPDMKILYMSGYMDEMLVSVTPQERETRFLEKPFSPDAMVRKVRQLLDPPAAAPGKAATAGK